MQDKPTTPVGEQWLMAADVLEDGLSRVDRDPDDEVMLTAEIWIEIMRHIGDMSATIRDEFWRECGKVCGIDDFEFTVAKMAHGMEPPTAH